MYYRPGKGDGSAQRGRSMLSTMALLADVTCYETSRFAWLLNNNRGRRVVLVAVCRALCVLYDTHTYLENKYALNFMPSFTTGRDALHPAVLPDRACTRLGKYTARLPCYKTRWSRSVLMATLCCIQACSTLLLDTHSVPPNCTHAHSLPCRFG